MGVLLLQRFPTLETTIPPMVFLLDPTREITGLRGEGMTPTLVTASRTTARMWCVADLSGDDYLSLHAQIFHIRGNSHSACAMCVPECPGRSRQDTASVCLTPRVSTVIRPLAPQTEVPEGISSGFPCIVRGFAMGSCLIWSGVGVVSDCGVLVAVGKQPCCAVFGHRGPSSRDIPLMLWTLRSLSAIG